MNAKAWIERYKMERHPEGGWFTRIWKSPNTIETPHGKRPASTAIHYLVERGDHSRWHKLKSDETWHFVAGGAIEIFEIDPNGNLQRTCLGLDLASGETPFHVVPAGNIFGSRPLGDYSLVSCVVAPGFEYEDFELFEEKTLSTRYPHLSHIF